MNTSIVHKLLSSPWQNSTLNKQKSQMYEAKTATNSSQIRNFINYEKDNWRMNFLISDIKNYEISALASYIDRNKDS